MFKDPGASKVFEDHKYESRILPRTGTMNEKDYGTRYTYYILSITI